MSEVYISLGSNLANPIVQIKMAVAALMDLPLTLVKSVSSFYRSTPWGGIMDQPDFINAVVALCTELTPMQLLEQLQGIESCQNRLRTGSKWGARTIDCDILLFDDLQLQSERLTIPHLYLEQRAFVLVPLAEIAPELILPNGSCVLTLARNINLFGLVKIEGGACVNNSDLSGDI